MRNKFACLGFCALLLIAIGIGIGAGYIYHAAHTLPDTGFLREYNPGQTTRIYAGNREQIANFCLEQRIPVSLAEISPNLIKAVLSTEDVNFYQHRGIYWPRVLRALGRNLTAGRFVEGASTITQQLTRLVFLYPQKTIERKVKEILLAYKIEAKYSKQEILELYLNHVYFGHSAYGVEAAARAYFGKKARDLNLPESALLAGLIRAPSRYSPFCNEDLAKRRCAVVLRRMQEEGVISRKQYQSALQFPFHFQKEEEKTPASYFVEYIRQELQKKYGSPGLYKGGLQVHTTLDPQMQRIAQSALRWGLEELSKRQGFRPLPRDWEEDDLPVEEINQAIEEKKPVSRKLPARVRAVLDDRVLVDVLDDHCGEISWESMKWTRAKSPGAILKAGDKVLVRIKKFPDSSDGCLTLSLEQEPAVQGALVALDPKTGHIRAMVGGYDFSKSQYNRAVQARRQPGSAFKPFIYTAALLRGRTLADIVIDSPIVYKDGIQAKGWKPENYSGKFSGPITIRKALERSSNVVTVKLLDQVGIDGVIKLARRMGINSPLDHDLSLALGTSGVSLLEITSAYGIFANQGIFNQPVAIKSILNDKGETLEKHDPSPRRVLDAQTSYLITSLLAGVIQHGTGWRAKRLGRPLAGKTGTTNDYIDAWFIGFSPELVAGVWVGFDEYKSLGERETGGEAACPIWVNFMSRALANQPASNFPVPGGITFENIDADTGLLATPDCRRVILEAFREGTEPDRFCNAHQIAADRFLSIDSQSPEKVPAPQQPQPQPSPQPQSSQQQEPPARRLDTEQPTDGYR
ncbi:MAG: PBP1A family penicillin-binding protein [bacterium]